MNVNGQQFLGQSEDNRATSDNSVVSDDSVIHVDLTSEQGEALASVLDNYLSDLRYEIANTDSNDFRHMLQRRRHELTGVLEKLRQATASTAPEQ
jgi:hypothetical protein